MKRLKLYKQDWHGTLRLVTMPVYILGIMPESSVPYLIVYVIPLDLSSGIMLSQLPLLGK